jgi:ABC-type phosphate/phosphonate transport system permease subunit
MNVEAVSWVAGRSLALCSRPARSRGNGALGGRPLFQWDRVALILLAILAVVVIAEVVVTQVRKRII